MRKIPDGHPRAVVRVGDHKIELIFLSTMERDSVYEQLLEDLKSPQPTRR